MYKKIGQGRHNMINKLYLPHLEFKKKSLKYKNNIYIFKINPS